MLLCIMLHNLMQFTVLFNAVSLYNACLFPFYFALVFFIIIYTNALVFILCLWVIDTICLFYLLFCITYSAFNHLVFIICVHSVFVYERAVFSEEIALQNNHYYY